MRRLITPFAFVLLFAMLPAAVAVYKPALEDQGFILLELPSSTVADDTVDWGGDPVRTVLRYRLRRNPALDHMLPDGAGGTHFVVDLDSNAGVALPRAAALALVPPADIDAGEATELHERAHLVWGAYPKLVDRIVSNVGRPWPGEYAAKDPGEHFSEMAGLAWNIVMPPRDFCLVDPPVMFLEETERLVPGTAGFVIWYLRQPAMHDVPGREALLHAAERMTEPLRAEWEALYAALEARRRSDGLLEPLQPEPLASSIGRTYRGFNERWIASVTRFLLLPSLAVARVYDAVS